MDIHVYLSDMDVEGSNVFWSIYVEVNLFLGVTLISLTIEDTFKFSKLAWCARKLT